MSFSSRSHALCIDTGEPKLTTDSASQDDVSFTGELTETGMKVAARSRFVSAIDRLGGNVVDLLGSPIDGWNERRKAKLAGEKLLIEAAAKFGVNELTKDGEFATRVFANHFGKLAREQTNRDAVLEVAAEDLTSSARETGGEGPAQLDEVFLDRFDAYAAQATTDALREKWGRILASEVRKPGTFSNKVMRVVDELAPETALLFEEVCKHRLSNVLPKCLTGELGYSQLTRLATAELIVDHTAGQISNFQEVTSSTGEGLWLIPFENRAVAFPRGTTVPPIGGSDTVSVFKGEKAPATPMYLLTDVGYAISTILDDHSDAAFDRYITRVRADIPVGVIYVLEANDDGTLEFKKTLV